MSLNIVESTCKAVLEEIRDLMAPGHMKLNPKDHMELSGRVRDCLRFLTNKEYGCDSGRHASPCDCKPGLQGQAVR